MKLSRCLFLLSLLTGAASLALAGDKSCCESGDKSCCGSNQACCMTGQATAVADTSADTELANYPLETCVVSDEKLGTMGKPFRYVHSEAGQADRVVYFCCKGCIRDFKKDPAPYLKKLDDAAAAKGRS